MPQPGQQKLLEVDVLNPHYPKFYSSKDRQVPSDDQNPIPVYFLAVKAEAAFLFPFHLRLLSQEEPSALGEASRDQLTSKVRGWLESALKTLGAGAKTAAGYGYFQDLETYPASESVESEGRGQA